MEIPVDTLRQASLSRPRSFAMPERGVACSGLTPGVAKAQTPEPPNTAGGDGVVYTECIPETGGNHERLVTSNQP